MGERPIGEGIDGLSAVEQEARREADELFSLVSGEMENVRRMIENARVDDVAVEFYDHARVLQHTIGRLGDELGQTFERGIEELETLRRPVLYVSSASTADRVVLRTPPPGTVVVVDQTLAYTTDHVGRVARAQATLTMITPTQSRDRGAQKTLRGKVTGDDAGHIIARVLGGIGEAINLTPMSQSVNRGQYRRLERQWERAITNGQTVDVDITLIYEDDGFRPSRLEIRYETENDDKTVMITNVARDEVENERS